MGLEALVGRVFEPQGPLAKLSLEFKPRAGQTEMALAVANVIESGGKLVVEAGTGVGKTFAYLVPALLSGHRVLVSTATKALQDQLFTRDIPELMKALGTPARIALLKGRSSYLCAYRLDSAHGSLDLGDVDSLKNIATVERWAATTRSGDIAELGGIDENSPVFARITSTRENCLGGRCPRLQDCHVNQARREALAADVVVINHHLFFADLQVRESGVAELLPSVHAVVFDEAHQLNEIGVQFLGRQWTTGQLMAVCRDLVSQGSTLVLGAPDWPLLLASLENAVNGFRLLCAPLSGMGKVAWGVSAPVGMLESDWRNAMHQLVEALQPIERLLQRLREGATELGGLHERCLSLHAMLDSFTATVPLGNVRWVECGAQVSLIESPLNIAQDMLARVFLQTPHSAPKSWIFTSATLGHDAGLEWFVQSCGLEGATVLQVESPFNHAVQSALYVPNDFPLPNDASHSACVAALVAGAAEVLRGKTLVLTTTLKAMRAIAQGLKSHFCDTNDVAVLLQGELPKNELIARFRARKGAGDTGFILVASATFWEGIDVPGESLQLVVIDKLPFTPPNDPLMKARGYALEASGKSAFQHLHLPRAAIALKQGAGRLIRRETDRGILVVCDVRLKTRGYGRKIIAALPAMRVIGNEGEFNEALEALTRPSTTDPY